ncbi:MAG: hypothetical protein ACRD0W_02550 [Acidimicrobiales bacterium]
MSDDVEPFRAELLCIEVHYQGSDLTIVLDGALDMTGAERFVACVVDVLASIHRLTWSDAGRVSAKEPP